MIIKAEDLAWKQEKKKMKKPYYHIWEVAILAAQSIAQSIAAQSIPTSITKEQYWRWHFRITCGAFSGREKKKTKQKTWLPTNVKLGHIFAKIRQGLD